MISVEKAKRLVQKNAARLSPIVKPLAESLGYVIAENLRAKMDLPPFNNSAMDGYVLRSSDTRLAKNSQPKAFEIAGIIQAGDVRPQPLRKGQAYQIMTGAMTPPGGDCVLIREHADIKGKYLMIHMPLRAGLNVRMRGEEIRKGTSIDLKNTVCHPGTLGFLVSLGVTSVRVYRTPNVFLVTTGNELRPPGSPLPKGCIYDSNSYLIQAALQEMGLGLTKHTHVKDNPGSLRKVLQTSLSSHDVILLTGGVSVGDYDHVKSVLSSLKVREIFWKVNQKPGKPLYVGMKRKTLVFGLPGNPASVFTCFYEYVYPALRKMMGYKERELTVRKARLITPVRLDEKRYQFLKGQLSEDLSSVKTLGFQGSHMLSSLLRANAFIFIPPKAVCKDAQNVETHLLPYAYKGGHG